MLDFYWKFILILGLLCFATNNYAQRVISGVIKSEENQERLPFADIMIKGTYLGASSNVDGYFAIFDAPEDSIILEVSYVGYANLQVEIEAGSADINNLEVVLTSGITLDELVVIDRSYKMMNASGAASTIQLSPRQLALLPNIGEVDIFRSLQLLPGISGSNESSSGLYVRGGTPDQNLVLFDGMTVYNVDHFFGFFSAFNADAVKDVKLFKGVFPAKYGGRLSSVVDLT